MSPAAAKQPQSPRWIEYHSIDDVPGADQNPKDHDSDLIGESFEHFGYIDAAILDERTGKLLGGHGRVERLRWERGAGNSPPEGIVVAVDGTWTMPVQHGVSSKDDEHAKRMIVALNRVGERGGWKEQMLGEMLDDMLNLDEAALLGTGYSPTDVDDLLSRTPLDPLDDESRALGLGDVEYRIIVTCDGEQHQAELLVKFEADGLTTRAIAQ